MKPTRILAPSEEIKTGDLAITNHGEVIVIEGWARYKSVERLLSKDGLLHVGKEVKLIRVERWNDLEKYCNYLIDELQKIRRELYE